MPADLLPEDLKPDDGLEALGRMLFCAFGVCEELFWGRLEFHTLFCGR
jgi:hypothetical protein